MCGLVGVAGSISKKEKDAFTMMLHLDIIRGKHSTGVASVKLQGDWNLVKKKGTAWDLFDSREFDQAMLDTSYCLIGHNRAATKGKVNNINAHPFEFQDVVGAHNGTLRGQHHLIDHKKFEVDSENIFYSIQQVGLEETLDNLDGAYALSFWDRRGEELVLLRNEERTLYYAYSEDNKTLFWASEAWMISVACSKNGIKFGEIHLLAPCHIYRFSFDRKFHPAFDIQCDIEKFEEFRPPKPVTYATGENYSQGKPAGSLPAPPKEKGSVSGNKLRVDAWSLVGKVVDFTIDGVSKSALGAQFAKCSPICAPDLPLQIYLSPIVKEFLYDDRVPCDTVFRAKVTSYRDGILYCDPRTVEEVVEEDDDGDEEDDDWLFPVYGGKEVPKDEWIELTKKGCCVCNDTPDSFEAEDLQWIGDEFFACKACKGLDFVQEYIVQGD